MEVLSITMYSKLKQCNKKSIVTTILALRNLLCTVNEKRLWDGNQHHVTPKNMDSLKNIRLK